MKKLKSMFVKIPEDYVIETTENGVETVNVIFNGPGTFARIPTFFIEDEDWRRPGEDDEDEEIRGGESKESFRARATPDARQVKKTLIFFNEFVDGERVNPEMMNSLGVSKIQITREQYDNVPVIDLLRKAEGTAVWSDDGTTNYYTYITYQDNGVWVPTTPMQYDATLSYANSGFDQTMYVMISTMDPKRKYGYSEKPLPPRLRF